MTIDATWSADQGSTVCQLSNGTATWRADLDAEFGGDTAIPNPHELLDSALAACTTLTLQIYAKRKAYDLKSVHVTVRHEESAGVYKMLRTVHVEGELAPAAREDLLRVANKCPVHKSLSAQISIETTLS
ncbi:OsmC family protein [Cupriavidus plantarum]|uniref:OsmC family protein n=1 Tax=Cupriavidus plantarum TaxID=942865 RepID=UPI0015C6D733|nr:OsmC family protein [Cupriavidus plantarum]NYI02132.1 putative redox protein [Cupriavidus plantarum]